MEHPQEPVFVGEADRYFYIGDSHSGVGTMVFETPGEGNGRFVTEPIGIWRFVASNLFDAEGCVGTALTDVLRRLGAMQSSPRFGAIEGLRPALTLHGNDQILENLALTSFCNDRPYVLCVGEIDCRYLLDWLRRDRLDFEVPFDTSGLEQLSNMHTLRTIPVDDMLRKLAAHFNPIFRALRTLHAAGMRSIFLHSLPPPTHDDADSERVYKHESAGQTRYKLVMFVNYLFEAVCNDIGIGFINTWPMVTKRNVLNPAYYLDGLHLNREHSLLSAREVHRQFSLIRERLKESANHVPV